MKRKIGILLMAAMLLFTLTAVPAQAAASFTASSSSVYVGSTVTVTYKFSATQAVGGLNLRVTFDNNLLTYKSYSCTLGNANANCTSNIIKLVAYDVTSTAKSCSVTLTFTGKAVGKAALTVNGEEVTDTDGLSLGTPSGSVSVTVMEKNMSANCNLKSITIPSGCTLSPAFSPNVTAYTCTVPYSVSSFPLDWQTEDKDAQAKASGAVALKVGTNTRTVTVTAPNGTTKAYKITITREASTGEEEITPTPTVTPEEPELTPMPSGPVTTVKVDDVDYNLCASIDMDLPKGFIITQSEYDGHTVHAGICEGLMLYQLEKDGVPGLFLYRNQVFQPYRAIAAAAEEVDYTVVKEKACLLPDSFTPVTLTKDEVDYQAYFCPALGEGYYVLSVIQTDTDTPRWVVYCEADGSVQTLSPALMGDVSLLPGGTPAPQNGSDSTKKGLFASLFPDSFDSSSWLLIGLIVLAMILLIVLLILLIVGRKAKKKGPDDPYNMQVDNSEYDDDDDEMIPEPTIPGRQAACAEPQGYAQNGYVPPVNENAAPEAQQTYAQEPVAAPEAQQAYVQEPVAAPATEKTMPAVFIAPDEETPAQPAQPVQPVQARRRNLAPDQSVPKNYDDFS